MTVHMKETEQVAKKPHQAVLQDRKTLELTGVERVGEFNEETVSLVTSLGEMTVRGEGLHLRHLDLESGLLGVEGQIDALQYTRSRRGRIFR